MKKIIEKRRGDTETRRRGETRFHISASPRLRVSASLIILLWSSIIAPAATVTGLLSTVSSSPYKTNLLFTPLSTPLQNGNLLITSAPTNVTSDALGAFSVPLNAGDYTVVIGQAKKDSFIISVPNTNLTFNLISLITNALTYTEHALPQYATAAMLNSGLAGKININGGSGVGNTVSNLTIKGNTSFNGADNQIVGGDMVLSASAFMTLYDSSTFFLFGHGASIYSANQEQQWLFNYPAAGANNVATLGEASNIVRQAIGNAITMNGGTNISSISLQGWRITTPHSQWDNTTDGPAHSLVFSSLGNQNTTDEATGDGYIQFSCNLLSSNTFWINCVQGDIYASPGNAGTNFAAKVQILKNTMISLTQPKITLGNNSNLVTELTLMRGGTYTKWSNAENSSVSFITNSGLMPQYHYSTNNGATDVYTVLGSPVCQVLTTTAQFTNGNIRMLPFYSGAGGMVDSLAIFINGNVTGGRVYFGIYTAQSPTNLYPGSLIFDAGGANGWPTDNIGPVITNLASPIHLNPGQYYWTAVRATTNITLKAVPNAGCMGIGYTTNFTPIVQLESVTTGTNLPDPATLTTVLNLTTGFAPAVAVRFSGP